QNNVEFGLKLTNTLEVLNARQVLPKQEATNYMSGRALHPISIRLAKKLQTDFDGQLDISFSAGADAFNVANILACNIKPVTTCTDVLKPGGYGRLRQYIDNISAEIHSVGAKNIDEFIQKQGDKTDVKQSGLYNLQYYAREVIHSPTYQNQFTGFESIKTNRELTQFDCITAPCIGNCATDQHIPEYIYHTAQGDFNKAFEVIMETNPLPGITGAVCDQLCGALKCTRSNYDNPLLIRDIKRYATEYGSEDFAKQKALLNNIKIAIIGGGPAGLSAAYFLALAGCNVEIFEAKGYSGGMVSEAIPHFRLSEEVFQSDVDRILNLGVQIHYNSKIDAQKFIQLREQSDYMYIAVGAQQNKKLRIDGEDLENVIEPVDFLAKVKQKQSIELGNNVVVIGGGNTAMDAVRTAKRLVGDKGDVTILYRRTRKEMPAEDAEIQAALDESIELIELVSPVKINGNRKVHSITCQRMKLGKLDASGRARPIPIPNSEFDINVDSIIPAIGQDIELDFLGKNELNVNKETGATNIKNIFAGGDAIRGAATVVEAVGDGQSAAKNILIAAGINKKYSSESNKSITDLELQKKAFQREYGISVPKFHDEHKLNFDMIHRTMTKDEVTKEANRCLYCDEVCSVCVYVCPNLANFQYKAVSMKASVQKVVQANGEFTISNLAPIVFEQKTQIITIGDFCNECGNCDTCPTAGAPYKTKPHIFLTKESFLQEPEGYYIIEDKIYYKNDNFIEIMKIEGDHLLLSNNYLSAIFDISFSAIKILHSKVNYDYLWSSKNAIQMGYLLLNLKDEALFTTK
ncbi:MAG: FAD-dependent oxidoreductase, partial [Planctomycetia bacterium]|nr:FAD-dependent oxidoreductase [Planctomycetia bacterium]